MPESIQHNWKINKLNFKKKSDANFLRKEVFTFDSSHKLAENE